LNDDYGDFQSARTTEPATDFRWPPAEGEPFLGALGRTWRGAALEPRAFFGAMPAEAPLGMPLIYYLIIGIAAAGARLFWALLGVGLDSERDAVLPQAEMAALNPAVEFLLSPALLLFSIFVAAAIVHALLRLFGGARHGYGFTTRVFAFAYSPAILEVVPVIGGITSLIWMTVILVVGLREGHATTTGRVLAAVLIPLGFALLLIAATTFLVATGELFRL
jgi:hypothetical protein